MTHRRDNIAVRLKKGGEMDLYYFAEIIFQFNFCFIRMNPKILIKKEGVHLLRKIKRN